MTLLTSESERKQPGVHALLIGVGAYPHLDNWHKLDEFPRDFRANGRGQLSSPYHSVEALTNWLSSDLNVRDAPLRSLRVLASSPVSTGRQYTVPTIGAIRQHCDDWFDDASQHEENVAFFYFCGHGLSKGDLWALLADDFGSDLTHRPFAASFEPSWLAEGMQKCKANRQLFLIDACSARSPRVEQRYPRFNPTMLLQPEENENLAKQTIILGSEFGTRAFGQRHGPSVFVEGFLQAVRGGAAEPADFQDNTWVVKSGALRTAINRILQARPEGTRQEVSYGKFSSDFEFHELIGDPMVPVRVNCNPSEFEDQTALEVTLEQMHVLAQQPWMLELPYGSHDFRAVEDLPGLGRIVHGQKLKQPVAPPYTKVSIKCGDEG